MPQAHSAHDASDHGNDPHRGHADPMQVFPASSSVLMSLLFKLPLLMQSGFFSGGKARGRRAWFLGHRDRRMVLRRLILTPRHGWPSAQPRGGDSSPE